MQSKVESSDAGFYGIGTNHSSCLTGMISMILKNNNDYMILKEFAIEA